MVHQKYIQKNIFIIIITTYLFVHYSEKSQMKFLRKLSLNEFNSHFPYPPVLQFSI